MPMILKDLKTGLGQIEFELDEAECAAIGRVTAHWAYLEHTIYAVTKAISSAVQASLPSEAHSTSFTRRLRALRLLVETYATEVERKRMTSLIGQIANAEQDRHRIIHGVWEWDKKDPDRIQASSSRQGYEFEKLFDTAKLHNLATRIGRISFALEYPNGWDEAFQDRLADVTDENGNVAFFHASRYFYRNIIARKAQNSGRVESQDQG